MKQNCRLQHEIKENGYTTWKGWEDEDYFSPKIIQLQALGCALWS